MSEKTICVIQHVACETPGVIAEVVEAHGIAIEYVRPFQQQAVPSSLSRYDGLVVMGGPMGVYEQDAYPFLRNELRLIEQALRADTPMLGVCLGSQLLAAALGAPVTRGPRKEIGWFPVTLTAAAAHLPAWGAVPSCFTAWHWHGDVFALPSGAVSLASSELTAHQAFAVGRAALGILFHLEVTAAIVAEMVATFADEMRAAGVEGPPLVAQIGHLLPELGGIGRTIFGGWAEAVASQ